MARIALFGATGTVGSAVRAVQARDEGPDRLTRLAQALLQAIARPDVEQIVVIGRREPYVQNAKIKVGATSRRRTGFSS
jgi:hypothetical protein